MVKTKTKKVAVKRMDKPNTSRKYLYIIYMMKNLSPGEKST